MEKHWLTKFALKWYYLKFWKYPLEYPKKSDILSAYFYLLFTIAGITFIIYAFFFRE